MRLLPLPTLALAGALLVSGAGGAFADPVPAAAGSDPPPNAAQPASSRPVSLGAGALRTFAFLRRAQGPAPHPVVVMLADLPAGGLEDLAEAVRRDGWDVLSPDPRGTGGSPGSFSFTHSLEDVRTALAWLRAPDGGVAQGVDPNKIVLVGTGLGAWRAAETAADDPHLIGVALISLQDLGAEGALPRAALEQALARRISDAQGGRGLGSAAPEALADELQRNSARWRIAAAAAALRERPLLLVTADEDPEASAALAAGAGEAASVGQVHLPGDRYFSASRIALAAALLRWLENLPGAPSGL